ncbi:MAG: DUF397 domain-containing protein [Pseudonocardiaceae bacterium]
MLAIPDHAWRKSSRCGGANNCVEVAHGPGWTAVRDSKNKTGPVLVFTDGEWDAFIEGTVARSVPAPTP